MFTRPFLKFCRSRTRLSLTNSPDIILTRYALDALMYSAQPFRESKSMMMGGGCNEGCCQARSVHVDTYITMVLGEKLVAMLPRSAAGLFSPEDKVCFYFC